MPEDGGPNSDENGLPSSEDLLKAAREELATPEARSTTPEIDEPFGSDPDQKTAEASMSAPIAATSRVDIGDDSGESPAPAERPTWPPPPPSVGDAKDGVSDQLSQGGAELSAFARLRDKTPRWIVGLAIGAAIVGFNVLTQDSPKENLVNNLVDGGATERSAECIADRLDQNGTLDAMADSDIDFESVGGGLAQGYSPDLVGFAENLMSAASVCMTTEEQETFYSTPAQNAPASQGDDPELDQLWNECAAGHFASCELLYRYSGPGTEYEQFALRCGDRLPSDTTDSCINVLGPGADFTTWRTDCEAGDNGACDLLFLFSPVGSSDESLGATCGSRAERSILGCGIRFGLGRN